jgi:hypothetical protein
VTIRGSGQRRRSIRCCARTSSGYIHAGFERRPEAIRKLEDLGLRRVLHVSEWLEIPTLLIRESGTEPVIRVMAEAEAESLVTLAVDKVCAAIAVMAQGAGALTTDRTAQLRH